MDVEIEGQKFVSSRTINRERQELREARENVLKNAEKKYMARVEKEEQAIARGDNKWMLPELEKELESKKKKKKHKKEKKKKDKKKDSDSDDEWIESDKNKTVNEERLQRDSFMEFGFLATYSKSDTKSNIVDKKKTDEEERKALGASRELNPHLRTKAYGASNQHLNTKPVAAHGGVSGDGGLGWLLKAFKRAEDQAKNEGQSLNEIAEKRWGSLDTYLDMVMKASVKASYIDRKLQEELNRLKREYPQCLSLDTGEELNAVSKAKEKHTIKEKRSSSKEKYERRKRSRSKEVSIRRKRSRSRDYKRRSRSRSREGISRRDRSVSPDRKFLKSKDRKSRSRSPHARRRRRSRSVDFKSRRDSSRSPDSRSRSKSRDDRYSSIKFARPSEKTDEHSSSKSKYLSTGSGGWKSASRRQAEQEEYIKKSANIRDNDKGNSESDGSSESEEEKISEQNSEKKVSVLTETEMNALASRVLKAELMGNDDMAKTLKDQLEAARAVRSEMIVKGLNPDKEPEVITKLKGHNEKQKKRKTKVETHKDGERVRYFGDDDRYDLKQMFQREKMNNAEDQHQMMARLSSKAEKTNDDYDVDDMIITKAAGKRCEEMEDIKRKNKAASNQMALEKTLQDCKWCIGSKRSQKHLMVSMGKSVYLSVPGTVSLADGHCFIVPMGHCAAGTDLDEDVWNEIQDYRKALVKMFRSQGDDCVFFETAMGFKKHPHMLIECVPVPEDLGSLLPMYFQKAIQECETEWTNNQKLVKLKDINIAKNIPKGLPYFHVDFGMDKGFAHVIEEEEDWNRRFAHEVVGGMMDVDARTMRNPSWESFDEQKRKVVKFGGQWAQYDWTKTLRNDAQKDCSSDSD